MGKDYSAAQELMEDEMKEYYSRNSTITPAEPVHVGQLLAVNAEEDAWLRAQVISAEQNKIKASTVYFVRALRRRAHTFSHEMLLLIVYPRDTINKLYLVFSRSWKEFTIYKRLLLSAFKSLVVILCQRFSKKKERKKENLLCCGIHSLRCNQEEPLRPLPQE